MRCLGRIIALFLLLQIIAILPATIWGVAFWSVGTQAETYTTTLDENVYEQLAPLVLPGLAATVHDETGQPQAILFIRLVENLDSDTWQDMSRSVVSPDWVHEETGRNASILLDFLDNRSDNLNIAFNTQPISENLSGEPGQGLVAGVMAEIATWEPCTRQQAQSFLDFLAAPTDSDLPRCRPLPAVEQRLEAALTEGLQQIIAWLPPDGQFVLRDKVLAQGEVTPQDYNQGAIEARQAFTFINNSLPGMILLPLMLFGLIVLLTVRSAKGFFLWAGLPLVAGGLLTIVPVFPWLYSLSRPLQEIEDDALATIGASAFAEVARALAGAITGPVVAVTFFMVLSGFGFLVLAGLLNDPEETAPTQYYYVPTSGTPPPSPTGVVAPATQSTLPDERTAITPPDLKQSPLLEDAKTLPLSEAQDAAEDIHTIVDVDASPPADDEPPANS